MLLLDQHIYKRVYAIAQKHNAVQTRAAHRIDKNRYAMLRAVTELSIAEARRVVLLPAWADSDQLPTLYTNRRELANLVGCSERTVYNCLAVLERAGLVQKILHGRQNDFELILHPWIVFGHNFLPPRYRNLDMVDKGVEKASSKNFESPPPSPSPGRRQNLPPISSEETEETVVISSNSGVDFVDKWVKTGFLASKTQNPLHVDDRRINRRTDDGTSKAEKQALLPWPPTKEGSAESHQRTLQLLSLAQLLPGAASDTDDGNAGESRQRLTNASAPAPHSPTAHQLQPSCESLAKELTVKFWKLAKEALWPNDYIAEGSDYEIRLLNLVWTDVMGRFEGLTTQSEITTRYFVRESQLKLATAYARKHGWTGFLPPPLYFSLSQYKKEKQSGQRGAFHWTYEWVKNTAARKKERHHRDQLQRALHSVIAHKAPQGLKNGRSMSRIQLYQYWHNRLGRLCDARILAEFYEQVHTHIPQH